MIDNYDSFTYNLVQYLGELGAEPVVIRNDDRTVDQIIEDAPDGILISPGPGGPTDAGVSLALLTDERISAPIFGVCLGMQCMGAAFGGNVVRAPQVMHGKTSTIHHSGKGVFRDLPEPIEATRYHSLIVDPTTLPEVLEITAETDDGLIMGLRHRTRAIEGVQFHPESILTEHGHTMLRNFLSDCGHRAG